MLSVVGHRSELDEDFPGTDLDPGVWLPYHLPHWSSRAESAATFAVRGGELHLTIPPAQGLWCGDLHPDPLRVSCIQSASWSGPVGSTSGPQPFWAGLTVRTEERPFWGYIPTGGRLEIRMRTFPTSTRTPSTGDQVRRRSPSTASRFAASTRLPTTTSS
jgi:hypothetical protein